MITFLTVAHIVVSILLIIFVLLQFGKGAEAGLVFSTETSSILPQSGNAITKFTSFLAVAFLVLSLTLSILKSHQGNVSLLDSVEPQAAPLATQDESSASAAPAENEKKAEPAASKAEDKATTQKNTNNEK